MDNKKQIGKLGSRTAPFLVELTEWQGRKLLSVRKYFTDRSTKELKPTQKGISITLGTYNALREILDNNEVMITEWFHDLDVTNQDIQARIDAAEAAKYSAIEVVVEVSSWKGSTFYAVEFAGGAVKVIFNDNHPYVAGLMGHEHAEILLHNSAMMISSYVRSTNLFEDSESEYEVLFDGISYEWGKYLENQ